MAGLWSKYCGKHHVRARYFQILRGLMRIFITLLTIIFAFNTQVFGQTADEVKRDILSALSTPLPITVIGPLITQDVKVTGKGNGFRVELDNPLLMGLVPLKSLSFSMTPTETDGLYRISDYQLPGELEILNAVDLKIGSTDFDGLWSVKTRSYEALKFRLNDVSIFPKNAGGGSVKLQSLALNVDKEGQSGAMESRFGLALSSLQSNGIGPDDISVDSAIAQLKADGKQPVDLYSVVSRFVVLSLMQGDQSALLRFAESLRARSYDVASLKFDLSGFQMHPANQPQSNKRFTARQISGLIGLTNMTPDNIGGFTINVNAGSISDNGYTDVEALNIDNGNITLRGKEIPIGATLAAVSNFQSLAEGRPIRIKVTDLIDGFFNFGEISISTEAKNVVFVPDDPDEGSLKISAFDNLFALNGFRQHQGKFVLSAGFKDVNFVPPKSIDAEERRLLQTLNPKHINYDLTISELNDELLRRLAEGIVISSENDFASLAVPAIVYFLAMKPVIETRDAALVTDELDVKLSGAVRFFPAWALSGLPYEGDSSLSITGLDKLAALVREFKFKTANRSPSAIREQETGRAVALSVVTTMKALAVAKGNSLVWNIGYPEAGKTMFTVNEHTLRFPNIGAYLPMLGLGGILR